MCDQVTKVMRKYPEFASDSEGRSLQTEIYMFLTLPAVKNEYQNLGTCSHALRSMVPTTHAMFPHVEALRLSTQHLLQRHQREASAARVD